MGTVVVEDLQNFKIIIINRIIDKVFSDIGCSWMMYFYLYDIPQPEQSLECY